MHKVAPDFDDIESVNNGADHHDGGRKGKPPPFHVEHCDGDDDGNGEDQPQPIGAGEVQDIVPPLVPVGIRG